MQSFQVLNKTVLVLAVAFLSQACNPVKQVLKDQSKFNVVAEEVIRRGYCINDTVVETKIDTLYQADSSVVNTISLYKEIDTIFTDGSTLRIDSAGNLSFGCPVKVQYKTVTKTETIRDKALEDILKKDIAKLDSIKRELQLSVKEKDMLITETYHKLEKSKRRFKLFIFALLAVITVRAYFKVRKYLPI